MSLDNQSLTIAVKKFQTLANNITEQDVTCFLFLNASPVSTLKISDSHNPTIISNVSLKAPLQLIFQTTEGKEALGCITFPIGHIISSERTHFEQWVTLFDDPEDDVFDGRIGDDDQEWPRALVSFDAKPQDTVSHNNDQVQEKIVHRGPKDQLSLDQEQIISEWSTSPQKEARSGSRADVEAEAKPVRPEQQDADFKLQIVKANEFDKDSILEQTISLNQTPNSFTAKEVRILGKDMQREHGNERLTMSPASPISIHDSRNISQINETFAKNEKNQNTLSEQDGVEISKQAALMIDLEQQNKLLLLKVNELEKTVEFLESEKLSLKKEEQVSMGRIHHLKIELERLKFHNENYETMFGETEQQLTEIKDQLTKEIGSKSELQQEKIELATSLKQTREAYEQLKNTYNDKRRSVENLDASRNDKAKSPNRTSQQGSEASVSGYLRQKYEEMLNQKDRRSREERNNLEEENSQLRQELIAAKSQTQCDENVIQNLQKEIFVLRQKEEQFNSLGFEGLVAQTEEKVKSYEAKLKNIMDACSSLLFTEPEGSFESFEAFVTKVRNTLEERNQELKTLRESHEEMKHKLSISENRLLADSLWNQINDFKQQVSSLEKDRESLRNELSKSNENYIKLTNKYTELTDVLTGLQKTPNSAASSSQKQPISATKANSTMFGRNNTARPNYRTFEAPDEVETKLIEFCVQYNIQPTLMTKIDKGSYLHNGRKLTLKVMNGKLLVKLGQGYKSLQEFLKVGNTCRTPPRSSTLHREIREKSNEAKSFYDRSEYTQTLATEPSQKDLSLDRALASSRSCFKENARESGSREFDKSKLNESCSNLSRSKTRGKDQAKLRQIVTSKSLERKLSFSLNRIISKNPREVTPF